MMSTLDAYIYVTEDPIDARLLTKEKIRADLGALISSKLRTLVYDIKQKLEISLRNMDAERCRLEKMILWNRLTSAVKDPNSFAFLLKGGPGYLGVVRGEVIHIVTCVPSEVNRRKVQSCYQDFLLFELNKANLNPLKKHEHFFSFFLFQTKQKRKSFFNCCFAA